MKRIFILMKKVKNNSKIKMKIMIIKKVKEMKVKKNIDKNEKSNWE